MPAIRPDRPWSDGELDQPMPKKPGSALARELRRPRLWLIGTLVLAVAAASVYVADWVRQPRPTAANGAEPSMTPEPGPAHGAAQGLDSASPSASASASASKSPSASAGKTDAAVGPRVGGAWPGPGNTGVPKGTDLSTYTGPCTIQKAGTVIDAKTVNCSLTVLAANVTIKRSKINGTVFIDTDRAGSSGWSLTLSDSEVDAGLRQLPAVSDGNMTVLRSNIYGGQTGVHCGEKASVCTVQDSWLHGQRIPNDADWHLGGFQSNGGRNVRIKHNTIVCDPPVNSVGGGCTGDLNLFGDFAKVTDVVADSNYFGANMANSYCLYAGDTRTKPYPNADHVVITNNVWQLGSNKKCGAYGPVAGFNTSGPGNVWKNNTWEDGTPVQPEN
ncbi:hypothetical protein [Dactylosporangium sp. NPDC048998]|uniref:hypothetical protein n=1 Tax=Dactylosporangium sp. NPDC048998 TaxID=3363976 RepID=UPI00371AFA8A